MRVRINFNLVMCYFDDWYSEQKSLLHELHSLLRVMWSGRMSMVISPHNMLYAVWNIIPFFRGYSQQDAQEFLSWVVLIIHQSIHNKNAHELLFGIWWNVTCRSNGNCPNCHPAIGQLTTYVRTYVIISTIEKYDFTMEFCSMMSGSRDIALCPLLWAQSCKQMYVG